VRCNCDRKNKSEATKPVRAEATAMTRSGPAVSKATMRWRTPSGAPLSRIRLKVAAVRSRPCHGDCETASSDQETRQYDHFTRGLQLTQKL